MNLITVCNVGIRQDSEGRYCLNDLHKASGDEPKNKPSEWLRNKQTSELIDEISKAGIPAIQSKQQLGTYVCKELVYAYAMWISAKFHLEVIRAYDAMTAPQPVVNPANLSRLQLIEIAMQAEQERIQLEHKVEVMTPKVEGFDRLATVAQGSFCIRDAAKNLQVQEKQLIQLLIEERWVYRRPMGSGMLAYSDKLQQGLMEHKVTTGEKSDGSEWTSTQARITVKGLTKLSLMFSSIHQFSRPVVPANGMVLQ